jgi:glycosyltransferase involved in cell wall biosynthesis
MFLCPARYVYGKNIDRLILAFIKFHKKYLNTKLRIVGDGELKEYLLSLIKEKSSEDFISLNSWSENMSEEYINTDYTILTSEFEGFGMILVESMKFGKPFLATPFGGATYLINDGINGFIAKDFSVEAIYELLEKSYLYKESFFSEKIKESVKNLTKQNMDEELIRLWKETI